MNRHIRFDDNDEIYGWSDNNCDNNTPIDEHFGDSDDEWKPRLLVDSDEEKDDNCEFNASIDQSDNESSDNESSDDECTESSDDECTESSDDETGYVVRTHVRSSTIYRINVNMEKFPSLYSHMTIFLGLATSETVTLLGRVAELIGWTMQENKIDQEEAVQNIVIKHPLDVLKYVTMLKGPEFGLKNGTIYNTLIDFGRWAKYLAIYDRLSIANFMLILGEQQKKEMKMKKQDINCRLSRENLIDKLHWPKNGMQELHNILMKHKARVDRSMRKGASGEELSEADIRFATDWIVALM